MGVAYLLGGVSPTSASIWLGLFVAGWCTHAFLVFCERHPRVYRDRQVIRRLVKEQIREARRTSAPAMIWVYDGRAQNWVQMRSDALGTWLDLDCDTLPIGQEGGARCSS